MVTIIAATNSKSEFGFLLLLLIHKALHIGARYIPDLAVLHYYSSYGLGAHAVISATTT